MKLTAEHGTGTVDTGTVHLMVVSFTITFFGNNLPTYVHTYVYTVNLTNEKTNHGSA